MNKSRRKYALIAAVTALAALLSGCGISNVSGSSPVTSALPVLRGNVHGGQQPVAGSSLALYAAGTSGYGAVNTNLLTAPALSDANGNFVITGDYRCTAGQQMYLVATGGNPGAGANANLALMAALGDCSGLTPSTSIAINELTTVGSIFALAPFMNSASALGSSAANAAGLAGAFRSVNKLVNTTAGTVPGPLLAAGAIAPVNEINTLGDILSACINSVGGTAGDGSVCGTLFSLTTPAGGAAPTDTVQAVLNLAHNPALNASGLFGLATANAPFAPALVAAPKDWSLAIQYTAPGLQSPQTTTVDQSGNIWVANAAANSVMVLAQTGSPVGSPLTGNGLSAPSAIAIDSSGDGWIANKTGNSVSVFTPGGSVFSGSPFTANGKLSLPAAIAIDAPGNVWVANAQSSTVTELTGKGIYQQQVSSGLTNPSSIAINPK